MKDIDQIKKILTSQFEIELFEAALFSLNDTANKLRYNNFAYSIRELSRHILYTLSPEINVKNCDWFTIETIDEKPSRTQRIKYAIQGGISDEILEKWGFNLFELNENIKVIKKTIDTLNKYTHINPDVFYLTKEEVEKFSDDVLASFILFVETIESCKEQIKKILEGHIEIHMISSVVTNFFINVDELAPHHSCNDIEVSEYQISKITDSEIIVDVFGNLQVTLEYGSRQDRRIGDGLDLEESFPFETKIRYEIDENFPTDNYEIDDYDVDTSEWYRNDENIEDEIDRRINESKKNC